MKFNLKTAFRIGAAILTGAAVFFGSLLADKSNNGKKNNNDSTNDSNVGAQQQTQQMSEAADGLRDVQNVVNKTGQVINTVACICDSIGRLFNVPSTPVFQDPFQEALYRSHMMDMPRHLGNGIIRL